MSEFFPAARERYLPLPPESSHPHHLAVFINSVFRSAIALKHYYQGFYILENPDLELPASTLVVIGQRCLFWIDNQAGDQPIYQLEITHNLSEVLDQIPTDELTLFISDEDWEKYGGKPCEIATHDDYRIFNYRFTTSKPKVVHLLNCNHLAHDFSSSPEPPLHFFTR